MAITYPVSLTIGVGKWAKCKFRPRFMQELSRTAGSKYQGADLGPMVWEAELETIPLQKVDADRLETILRSLRGYNRTAYVHVHERLYPGAYGPEFILRGFPIEEEVEAAFSSGFNRGFATEPSTTTVYEPVLEGTVYAIESSRNRIRFSGFNPGLVLTLGDYISLKSSSDSIELMQVTDETITTNSSGITPYIQMAYPLRPSIQVGDSQVRVLRPFIEAFIPADSIQNEKVSGMLHKVSFSAVQVVR